jgi:hypothetical protein
LTPGQTLRSIQLPQALTAMLPALIGQLVVVLKDSALGYQHTYQELLLWSKTLGSAYADTVPAYVVAAVLFTIVNYTLTVLARHVERRLSRRGKTSLPAAAPEGISALRLRKRPRGTAGPGQRRRRRYRVEATAEDSYRPPGADGVIDEVVVEPLCPSERLPAREPMPRRLRPWSAPRRPSP